MSLECVNKRCWEAFCWGMVQCAGHSSSACACWHRTVVQGSLYTLVCVFMCPAGDVLQDMGLRDAFNVQLSVPALNGDAVTTVLRSLDCFNSGEVLQVRCAAVHAYLQPGAVPLLPVAECLPPLAPE